MILDAGFQPQGPYPLATGMRFKRCQDGATQVSLSIPLPRKTTARS
jgi:hypothetical protein